MKVSLAWVFDHIKQSVKSVDVAHIIAHFNVTTAEIEGFQRIRIPIDSMACARVISVGQEVKVVCAEWNQEYALPLRKDAVKDALFLIKRSDEAISWVTCVDFASTKDGLLARIHLSDDHISGAWKNTFEATDCILELDNKSITNRPDMWGYRGFAREVAAILDLDLIDQEDFLHQTPVQTFESITPPDQVGPICIDLRNSSPCKRFAGVFLEDVNNRPSSLFMAARLLRVDTRAINCVVDVTNYVMLDTSQPMHAFDGATFASGTVMPRCARAGEKLKLLDDETVELCDQDMVITDGQKLLALGGVMGGREGSVTNDVKTLFIESIWCDPSAIRRTAVRYKKRTEASSRFEKCLDPSQNVLAIKRFLALLDDEDISYKLASSILSVGFEPKKGVIKVAHSFIEKRLGVSIQPERVIQILEKIGFELVQDRTDELVYDIAVPSWRSAKDVTIKEDIIEEVGRFYGYDVIPGKPITIPSDARSNIPVLRLRSIKDHCAYSLQMREVFNYALYDENFLRKLNWYPKAAVELKNPISEQAKVLATSLMPHLLQNIEINAPMYDSLAFFEVNRVWAMNDGKVDEGTKLSGIVWSKQGTPDFYGAKDALSSLFNMLGINTTWHKAESPAPWFNRHRTATVRCAQTDTEVGVVGLLDSKLIKRLAYGHAWGFELDCDFLVSSQPEESDYQPVSKFPPLCLDVSIMCGKEHTVASIEKLISSTDERISSVTLRDRFEKVEWPDQHSLTFGFVVRDASRTMSSQDIDELQKVIAKSIEGIGGTVR
ncbi:phenylalanine--tRNA ligase subunit beta [bacterium]|nr:phenylalanine--tRNA ligase subunit beta [bacterium]MBT3903954.1 phenylalanine--tRNA ligase subunit beta [bacterium]MBT4578070.1 phenylalanine--tRNA ligase subunit beta [bacterium]MBT5345643.1 phenylalanine--tRNA ligase subunit beta [bacterium]MBT6130670.1 phenylalanine--tRNA ligase subunit beta [bacterium]